MGVDGGYKGLIGVLASKGSTSAFQGPWKGFPSTKSVSIDGSKQSQLGSECILFRRMLRLCSLSRALNWLGRVLIPVESAIRTFREMREERNKGSARRGLDAMFSSSKQMHEASAGGRATKKLAEISRARRVVVICGSELVRKEGTAFGVVDDPMSKWVVPTYDD